MIEGKILEIKMVGKRFNGKGKEEVLKMSKRNTSRVKIFFFPLPIKLLSAADLMFVSKQEDSSDNGEMFFRERTEYSCSADDYTPLVLSYKTLTWFI